MENSTTIEMEPVGSGANTSSPETGQQNISCVQRVKDHLQSVKNSYIGKKLTSLIKLGIAIWVFGDIVSDAFQTEKYRKQSSGSDWNPDCNMTTSGTDCSNVCRNFSGISWHYFSCAIVTWIMPPFICGLYFYHGIVQKEGGYDRKMFFCCYGLGLLINVLAIVLATLVGAVYVYIKLPIDLIRLALFDLGVIPQTWAL